MTVLHARCHEMAGEEVAGLETEAAKAGMVLHQVKKTSANSMTTEHAVVVMYFRNGSSNGDECQQIENIHGRRRTSSAL